MREEKRQLSNSPSSQKVEDIQVPEMRDKRRQERALEL